MNDDALELAVRHNLTIIIREHRYYVGRDQSPMDICCLYENEDHAIDIREAIKRAALQGNK